MKMRFTIFPTLLLMALYGPGLQAQNVVVAYQGSIQDGGTNFTGTGLFQFALVTSSNANQTATATAEAPVNGFITAIDVAFGGSGYVTAPVVTIFGGGGTGAMATATISNGVVKAVNINTGGNGANYTNAPTVTIAAPPPALTYTTYWSNDGTSVAGSEPLAAIGAGVTNGLFTVGLGDITVPNMSAISASLFGQSGLQLQIWFSDGENGFAALSPVENLATAPYAAFADNASNILGAIPAARISGTVLNSTLPTNAVFPGPVTATVFSGSGTNLTSLNAGSLTVGTVPLSALSGITSNQLNATTWQMATNLNGGIAILADNVIAGIAITNATIIGSSFSGNGAGVTNLSGAQLVSIGNSNPSAGGNFFLGAAGNSTMAGYNNTGIGVHALDSNTNGLNNMAAGLNSLMSSTGGNNNTAIGTYTLQANVGGNNNTALGLDALYSNTNGSYNTASGIYALYSTLSGGDNTADGTYALQSSTSGFGNTAIGFNALNASTTGSNNIALGYLAGQAIVAGSSNIDIGNVGFSSDANVIRIGSGQTATYLSGTLYVNGMALTSDRAVKENFTPINPKEVLSKVLAMPVNKWQYKTDAVGINHIGPMAQDFHSAFGLNGTDDKHISVVDEGGVALAAIQGLNQKLNEKDTEIQALEARLEKLERLVNGG
ncbi:MAG TPA: tail fiber domain-containing protein, partial [Verrucomicrobiae bacterium]